MKLFDRILSNFAPHLCVSCGAEGAVLCVPCAQRLSDQPPRCYRCGKLDARSRTCRSCRSSSALSAVYVCTPYDGVAKVAVHRLKYEGACAAALDIARAMAARMPQSSESLLITHVPTANSRVRQRGYDQARLIARELACLASARHATLLARVGAARQVGASGARRREQLRSAFRPLKPRLITNADVLLVDDVLTTGSTFEAAAAVLKAAGARRIYAVAFAQA